jgi:hypothetical protein
MEMNMTGKRTLIALSAALAVGLLGAASVAQANDVEDNASSAQVQRDWQDWQRTLGHNTTIDNGRSAYGFATQHELTQAHKNIGR